MDEEMNDKEKDISASMITPLLSQGSKESM